MVFCGLDSGEVFGPEVSRGGCLFSENKLAKCAVGKREVTHAETRPISQCCCQARAGLQRRRSLCHRPYPRSRTAASPCSKSSSSKQSTCPLMRSSMALMIRLDSGIFGRRAVALHHHVWSVRSPQDGRFTPQSGFGLSWD